jgi:hypothetical protein
MRTDHFTEEQVRTMKQKLTPDMLAYVYAKANDFKARWKKMRDPSQPTLIYNRQLGELTFHFDWISVDTKNPKRCLPF